MTMTLDRLRLLIDAYGADPARWPEPERAGAATLLAASDEARALVAEAAALDRLLARYDNPAEGAINQLRLVAAITSQPQGAAAPAGGLPRPANQNQITLGWPNFAALAAAAIVGFVVGWSGLDQDLLPNTASARSIDQALVLGGGEDWTW
jgi:hypothetical protein